MNRGRRRDEGRKASIRRGGGRKGWRGATRLTAQAQARSGRGQRGVNASVQRPGEECSSSCRRRLWQGRRSRQRQLAEVVDAAARGPGRSSTGSPLFSLSLARCTAMEELDVVCSLLTPWQRTSPSSLSSSSRPRRAPLPAAPDRTSSSPPSLASPIAFSSPSLRLHPSPWSLLRFATPADCVSLRRFMYTIVVRNRSLAAVRL